MAKAATQTAPAAAPKAPTPSLKIVEVTAGNVKAASEGTTKFGGTLMVPPGNLRIIPNFNVRVKNKSYAEDTALLVESIKSQGFYQTKPLSGFVGKDGDADVIFVTDGHRRLEAVNTAIEQGAEIPAIPVVLKDPKTSMIDLNIALVLENSGKRLSMLENAIIVKRMLQAGKTEEEVEKSLGFTRRGVQDFIVLIGAPKGIRRAVMDEKITGTEAVRQLRKFAKEPKKAEEAIEAMIDRAEKAGKDKATRKDSGDKSKAEVRKEKEAAEAGEEAAPKVKLNSVTTDFKVEAGASFELKDISAFSGLLGTDWYTPDEEREGWAKAVEHVEFKGVVKRPKKDDPKPADKAADATEAEAETLDDEPL